MVGNTHENLKGLHDQYDGERIFIIGNGPSLEEAPLEQLEQEYTFALNSINHIYEKKDWRPTFYLFMKTSMDDKEREFVKENIDAGCICFLNSIYEDEFGNHNNIHYLRRKGLPADPLTTAGASATNIEQVEVSQFSDVWEENITRGVYKQHSMYPLLQIAHYLGFDEIYLLGCDLGFEVQKPYLLFEHGMDPAEYSGKEEFLVDSIQEQNIIRSAVNGVAYKLLLTRPVDFILRRWTSLYEDSSHFTESYDNKIRFKDVNEEISNAHRVAKRVLNEQGVMVYNATPGGELEVYPRVDLTEVITSS